MSTIQNIFSFLETISKDPILEDEDREVVERLLVLGRVELVKHHEVVEAAEKAKNMLGAHIGHDMTRDERKRMNHDVFDWLDVALKELEE